MPMNEKRLNNYIISLMAIVLLVVIAVRFASPIKDGDFFWHIAYGKYHIENKTLIPDHTIFSWTASDGSAIKCNWLSDVFLYILYTAGGLPLLFVLRYVCYFILLGVVALYAFKINQRIVPLHFLMYSIAILSSSSAGFIKPEIFSMVFFCMLFACYFNAKILSGNESFKILLAIPLLFVFWVNIHEVFLFGLMAFGLIFVGEILNYIFKTGSQHSSNLIKYMSFSFLLSVFAVFVNPYGYRRLLVLCTSFLESGDQVGNIEAYKSIFFSTFSQLYYFDYWLIMFVSFCLLTGYIAWKKKEWDWALIIPTLFLAIIYLKYARATYYWAAFWTMSMVFQLSRIEFPQVCNVSHYIKKLTVVVPLVMMMFLSFRVVDGAIRKPFLGQWFGFGSGYSNPVQSSEFIKKNKPGTKLYNSYCVGGYLIWDLFPLYKVFMDPRYFPYKSWYKEYYSFNNGGSDLGEFNKKYPFDMAILDYHYSKDAINKLLLSDKWEMVFYGSSAVVFVNKQEKPVNYTKPDKERFNELNSVFQAYTVFNFAQNIGDYESSEYIYSLIKDQFTYMHDYDKIVYLCSLSWKGLQAMEQGDFATAYKNLEAYGLKPYMIKTNKALLMLRRKIIKQYIDQGMYGDALHILEKTLSVLPDHVYSLYNAGILAFILENKGAGTTNIKWRDCLKRVIELAPNRQYSSVAQDLLSGKGLGEQIPLIL